MKKSDYELYRMTGDLSPQSHPASSLDYQAQFYEYSKKACENEDFNALLTGFFQVIVEPLRIILTGNGVPCSQASLIIIQIL
jgi:hypothetical protein